MPLNAFEYFNIGSLHEWLTPQMLHQLGKAALVLLATGVVVVLAQQALARLMGERLSPADKKSAQTALSYTLWPVGGVIALRLAGVNLNAVLPGGTRGVVRALVALAAASCLAPLARRSIAHLPVAHWKAQHRILAERVATYLIWAVAATTSLNELGFNLTFVLGTAGFVAGAATFASQQSVAQIVSGLFLIIEQPFAIGDTVQLGGVTGEVLSIDWLSTKLRTPDNLFVRVPNATTLNTIVTTVSHFPIRRLDIQVGVAYGEDIEKVTKTLFDVAEKNALCLEDPKPLFMFLGYGESALDLQFSVWGRRERFLDLKNSMHNGIKLAFAQQGIDIPFPHRALTIGNKEKALPLHADWPTSAGQTKGGAATARVS